MTRLTRKIVLASVTLLLAGAAQSVPVLWKVQIDFETYGVGGSAVVPNTGTDQPIGTSANGLYLAQKVDFSPKFEIYPVYTNSEAPIYGKPPVNGSSAGHLLSREPKVSISIDKTLEIEHVLFDYAYADAPGVTFVSDTGIEAPLVFTSGNWTWSKFTKDFNADFGYLTRIDFDSPAYLALDNLWLGVTDPGTGGTVPEPAGWGLVALAVFAAAVAARRRQR